MEIRTLNNGYDYTVVVGGGTAGCAPAARLARELQDSGKAVLPP